MTEFETKHSIFRAALHEAVMVDRSEYGMVLIKGKDALDLLHRLSTNDLLAAGPGHTLSTVFTTEKGKIFDYVKLFLQQNAIIAVTSQKNEKRFIERIEKYVFMEEVVLVDITCSHSMISLIGPRAYSTLSEVFNVELTPGGSTEGECQSGRSIIGWTREFDTDFIDVITESDRSEGVRRAILGWKGGGTIQEIDAQVYDTFRISRGIPAFGSELAELWNPYEVGLAHAISFKKGCYTGQEVIARLNAYDKVQRKLVGLVFRDSIPESGGTRELFKGADRVGTITSRSGIAVDGRFMALGIVNKQSVHTQDRLALKSNQGEIVCTVTDFPIPLGTS
jgi:tRNA-modifying protein YgfZ